MLFRPCLIQSQKGIDHNNRKNDDGVGGLAHKCRYGGGADQDQNQDILKLIQQFCGKGLFLFFTQFIGAVLFEFGGRLFRGQSVL